jgi:hypothetical protein
MAAPSSTCKQEVPMSSSETGDPLSRLHRLPDDVGSLVAKAIAPVEDVIREIGVPFRASHFAEDCRDWDPQGYGYYQGHASRFAFALEATDGRLSEYALCAAPGPDGQCGLYVSVCESHVVDEQREGRDGKPQVVHRVEVDRVSLVKPSSLSLALRAQLLDELHQGNFLRAYRQHVEEHAKGAPEEAVFRYWLPKHGA